MSRSQSISVYMISSAALLAITALGACGGGDSEGEASDAAAGASDAAGGSGEITGLYDSVALQSGPCDDLEPSTLAPPFVLVDSLQTTYYVRSCQTPEDTDCPSIYYDFNVPIENGFAAEGGSAVFSAQCTLSWERSRATLVGDTLSVHTLYYQAIGTVTEEAECNLANAEAVTNCSNESLLTARKR